MRPLLPLSPWLTLAALLAGGCKGSSGSGPQQGPRPANRPSPAAQPAAGSTREPDTAAVADETRAAWEGLRYEAGESPAPRTRNSAAPPTAAPEGPAVTVDEPVRSPMEEAHARAKQIEPRVQAASTRADDLDRDARFYHEACYSLYAQQSLSGKGSPEALDARRAPGGREFFAVWASREKFAWSESWQQTRIPIEVSAECGRRWNELEEGARALATALQAIEDQARQQQVLPGDLRDLLSRHGFDGWDEILQR